MSNYGYLIIENNYWQFIQEARTQRGILGTARIKSYSAIQAKHNNVQAIAAETSHPCRAFADKSMFRSYGSDDLLRDVNVNAVYILPNHEHMPWTIKALQAGKHVLVEPFALSAGEPANGRDNHEKSLVMENFMYRYHRIPKRSK